MKKIQKSELNIFDSQDKLNEFINQIYQPNQNSLISTAYNNHHKISGQVYQFPILLLQCPMLSGIQQFKKRIQEEAKNKKKQFDKCWIFQTHKISNNHHNIQIKCMNCTANICYRQNNDLTWTLLKYNNKHIHQLQAGYNNKHLNTKINKVGSSNINTKFKAEEKRNLSLNNFQNIKILLKSLDYDFRSQHNPTDQLKLGYPQTLVAASAQQKNNYRRYGETISYDITYNCIKQITFDGKKFGVGIFSGFDNNKRIIIFGFSITTFETIKHFKNVFKWFFDLMGYSLTTAIITDQQQSIISALKQLKQQGKYKYHHIFDNWHFIHAFVKSLKGIQKPIIQTMINQLKRTMNQSDPYIGQIQLQKLKQMMTSKDLLKQYKKVECKIDHVCIWRMPKQFIGLSLHSNQCLNDLLKIKIEQQNTIYYLIEGLNKVSKQRNNKSETHRQYEDFNFESHFRDFRIKEVRQKLQKKVFRAFIYNYNRSQFYSVKFCQQFNQYRLKNIKNNNQYIVTNWMCSCGAHQKIGIPCQHIIYIKKEKYQKQGYIDLFNKRWLASSLQNRYIKNKKLMI